MNKSYVVFAAAFFLVVAVTQPSRSEQTTVEVVSKSEKIPRNFKTRLFQLSPVASGRLSHDVAARNPADRSGSGLPHDRS